MLKHVAQNNDIIARILKELDDKIRKLRTRGEGKILEKAGKIVAIPKVKKVDEKAKNLRSAEILFAAKKADWDAISELSQELKANSDTILILTEGLCESLFRAVKAFCSPVLPDPKGTRVEILSSALHGESLEALTRWIVGRKVSLVLVYQNTPSERLFWTFRVLLKALSQGRHPDEVHRRVIVSTGEAASSSESWAHWGRRFIDSASKTCW